MALLTLLTLFGILAVFLLDGNWKAGITLTILIGFLQDPIRKITPDQPSWFVGLVLISFALSCIPLYFWSRGFNVREIVFLSLIHI